MGKSKPKVEVTEYRMSLHFGICSGPLDYISKITINEKEAWTGQQESQGDIVINKPELFGGVKKDGGATGTVTYLPGASDQVIPEKLATKAGLTSATMPAYRGTSTAWFAENDGDGRKGFYWTANNPYLPGVWITAARASVGLPDIIARIYDTPPTDNAAFYFALDVSNSMQGVRLIALKSNTIAALNQLEAREDLSYDIRIVAFSDTVNSFIEFRDAEAADFDDMRAFVTALTRQDNTTNYNNAVSQAATYFAGSGSKVRAVIIIGDNANQGSDPTSGVAGAVSTLAAITDVQTYCFRVWGAGDVSISGHELETIDTTPIDSSGLVPVLFNASNAEPMADALNPFPTFSGRFDSNPAHIIYECLTNVDWGMGASSAQIDVPGFEAAAATLYAERFGLSMIWTQQSTVESFIGEILDHIEATLFVNPLTGLLTLKLIRDDYVIEDLPVYTPDNSIVTNFSRKLWGETINEIAVSFTNPENEEEETVIAQDLANITAQGGIVSDSRNYYGVRVKELAVRLAQRDIRAAASPLASCEIEVNREAWDLLPGGVVVINSPDDGINAMVMRVLPVNYGKPGDSTVKASLVEDVFSLPTADYTIPPDTESEDPSEDPSPADNTLILTLPHYLVANTVDPSVSTGAEYPEVFAGVLASEGGADCSEFELYGEVTDTLGVATVENLGTKTIASRATLPAAIDAEAETIVLSFSDITQGAGPTVGGFMLIEGTDETDSEFCLISDFDVGGYTLKRGVLDTVPRAWPIDTPVWFISEGVVIADETIRSDAEIVDYQVLPRTSLGLLDLGAAPVETQTLTGRPHLPLRPADVTVDGDDGFAGVVDVIGLSPIPVAFARRNRLTEDSVVLAWDAADVTPEAGQTTTVTLTDLAGVSLFAYTGIAGTTQDVDPSDFGIVGDGYIVVSSVRDGLDSLQGYRVRVLVNNLTADTTAYTADTTLLTADRA